MLALTENNATRGWAETEDNATCGRAETDSIATELEQAESPLWEECMNALLDILHRFKSEATDNELPNPTAIHAALSWITFLRKEFPCQPPTYVVAEPGGGIIVERRARITGKDSLCELTFYNDGRAERTDYINGRVVEMLPIQQNPHDCDT